jgi:uncharacterized phage-associated protein
MAPAAVESSFDVAYWFVDRALNENEYIQPQKMHRLMYLAQAYFAVAYHGRQLMPAVFVADQFGPTEPNVFRACAIQRPAIDAMPLPAMVDQFLDSIWRRFGPLSADALSRHVNGHPPYQEAFAKAVKTEITLKSMIAFYGRKTGSEPERANRVGAPPVEQVLRPRVMVSQDGKPVSVHRWRPKSKGDISS